MMSLHEEALETEFFSGGNKHKLSKLLELFYKEDENSLILAMTSFPTLLVKYIGENPRLVNLKTLSIELGIISGDDLKILLESPNLQNIETLNLRSLKVENSPLPYDTICNLKLKNLKKLIIRGFEMPKDKWKQFAKNVCFLSLESLELSYCWEIHNKGLKYIAKSENFKNLEFLNLSSTLSDRLELEAFCASANFPNLKNLSFESSKLSKQAFRNLFSNENFSAIEKLNLRWTFLGESLTADMRDCRAPFKNLKKVILSNNFFTVESFATFAEIFSSVNLEHLVLTGNDMNLNLTKALVDSKMISASLKFLNLRQTGIDDEGIKLLAQCNLSNLEILILEHADVTDEGIKVLLNSQNFENLKCFDLWDTKVTEEGFNVDLSGKFQKIERISVPHTAAVIAKLPERFKEVVHDHSKIFEDEEGFMA
jgi:hypothetical protein